MAFPNPPAKIVPFNSGPVASHDVGRQFDEHQKSIREVIDFLRTLIRDDGVLRPEAMPAAAALVLGGSSAPPATGVLGPQQANFYATDEQSAGPLSSDYAQVAIAWAEHMPDTIPPNILAINAITGAHWSSRWWANRALLLCQAVLAAGFSVGRGAFAEQLNVTGPNALAALTNPPLDALTTMTLTVNGRVFSGCAVPAPFTVSGTTISWASTIYGVNPGDEVIARYICATGLSS